jgi:hypothetical protein
MVLSSTARLSLRPATEQPRQIASAAQVESLANPGDRHRRPGSELSGQARSARLPFPHQLDLRRRQGVGLVDEVAEGALKGQVVGGEGAAVSGSFLPSPSSVFLAPWFLNAPGFRFALSPLWFQLFVSCQSSNVRGVCCWREVIAGRR